jgi:short-subunit dehydrogenase
VTITALCPGVTATGMLETATAANDQLGKLPGFLVGDVNEVAAAGYKALMRGEVIRVPGVANLAATLAARATPKWLLRRVAGTVTRQL